MGFLSKWATPKIILVLLAVILAQAVGFVFSHFAHKAEIAAAEKAAAKADKALSGRIAAESTAIAEAVSRARAEEALKLKDQQEKYHDLKKNETAANVAAVNAQRGLLQLAQAARSACNPSGGQSAKVATGVQNTPEDGFRGEDRDIVKGLLGIAAEARIAAEQRNFLASEYITKCEAK